MISKEQRRELFDCLRLCSDVETATLLLEVTMPVNIELATHGDIQELRSEMQLRCAQVEERITKAEENMLRQVSAMQVQVQGRVIEMGRRLSGLNAKMSSRLFEAVIPALATSNLLTVAATTCIGIIADRMTARRIGTSTPGSLGLKPNLCALILGLSSAGHQAP